MQSVSNVKFDRPFHLVSSSARDQYSIYALDQPLAPGDNLQMTFNIGYRSHGFRDGNERAELAYNGTFFDSSYFPPLAIFGISNSTTRAAAGKSASGLWKKWRHAATPRSRSTTFS